MPDSNPKPNPESSYLLSIPDNQYHKYLNKIKIIRTCLSAFLQNNQNLWVHCYFLSTNNHSNPVYSFIPPVIDKIHNINSPTTDEELNFEHKMHHKIFN